MAMQLLKLSGTNGPIYRAVLDLVRLHIDKEGLPDILQIVVGAGDVIVQTNDLGLHRYLKQRLSLDKTLAEGRVMRVDDKPTAWWAEKERVL